jgi:hypothetical protein
VNPPIFPLLTADATVSALVGVRVYEHGHAPRDVARPYVTWTIAGGHAENYIDQAPTMFEGLVQVDCWSETSAECKRVRDAVIAVLERAAQMSGTPIPDWDDDAELYRWIVQYDFWTSR